MPPNCTYDKSILYVYITIVKGIELMNKLRKRSIMRDWRSRHVQEEVI